MDQLYKEYILDLYRNPLNQGSLFDPDVTKTGYNPSCGDEITVDISFNPDGTIADIAHRGQGCAISIAAVSLMTEAAKGKSKEEVMSFSMDDVVRELGIDVGYTREKCAMLGLGVIHNILKKASEC